MKKKKSFVAAIGFLFIVFMFCSGFTVYSRQGTEVSEQDNAYVIETFKSLMADEEIYPKRLSYTINDLYLLNNSLVGYVYDFKIDRERAFAIMLRLGDSLEVAEFAFDRPSPFYGKRGKFIYPSLGVYYLENAGKIINLNSQEIEDIEPEEYAADQFYSAGKKDKTDVKGQYTENVTKIIRDEGKEIKNFYYNYYTSLTNHTNNCANAAGVILLNYWNKYYNNNLLNEKVNSDGNLTTTKAKDYMTQFYKKMHTNWFFGIGGTLPRYFYTGFRDVVIEKNKNYKVTTDSKKMDSNFENVMNKIKAGIPIAITSADYYLHNYVYGNDGQSGNIKQEYERSYGIANAHTMIGFGYKRIKYFRNESHKEYRPTWSNWFRTVTITREVIYRTDNFLKVANGWGGVDYLNYNLSNKLSIAAVEVVKK